MKKNTYFYRTAIFSLLFFSFAIAAFAQQEKRSVLGFSGVSYSLPGDLKITQGDKESLILYGDKSDLERIITRVDGGDLEIYTKDNSSGLGDVKCELVVVNLSELSIAGSGDVLVEGELKTDDMEISLSGSGSLKVKSLMTNEVEISLAGSGNIYLAGEAGEEVEISSAGSGNIDAANLKAKEVEVSLAGSGNAKVWAEDELEVSIVGSGSVEYKGNPQVDSSVSGSGSTRPL